MQFRTFLATCTLLSVAMTTPAPGQLPFLPAPAPHLLSAQCAPSHLALSPCPRKLTF